MAPKVSEMTADELRDVVRSVVETTVERKLLELLGDPDEGFLVRRRVRDRLMRQQTALQSGERGRSLEEAAQASGWE
jgi:hypothetical protein